MRRNGSKVILSMCFLVLLFGSSSVAAKGKPPKDQPSTEATGCPGEFPAFAFTRKETRARIRHGKSTLNGTELRVANSTGDCSVLVLTTTDVFDYFAFDQTDGAYRVAYGANGEIRVATFTVTAPDPTTDVVSVAEPLPLDFQTVYQYTGPLTGASFHGIDLEGEELVFSLGEYLDADGDGTNEEEIFSVDFISNLGCFASGAADCVTRMIEREWPSNPFPQLLYPSLSNDGARVYFYHAWSDSPDLVVSISYLDTARTMTIPRAVVTNIDLNRPEARFRSPNAVVADLFENGAFREYLAYTYNLGGAEILAIDHCLPLNNPDPNDAESCLSTGSAQLITTIPTVGWGPQHGAKWATLIAGDEPGISGNDRPPNLLIPQFVDQGGELVKKLVEWDPVADLAVTVLFPEMDVCSAVATTSDCIGGWATVD